MLQSLDPHSVYLPAQQARSINERLEGGFNGIGLEYQLLRDTLVITQVNADGPAAKAGVVVGDRVINVDGKAFSGTKLNVTRISKIFRGEKDTHIALGILRDQSKTIQDFDIKRDRVSLSSVDAAFNVGDTGYIKISKFASTTDADFRKSLIKN
jgi:carboxyl-terminal processing protease